MTSIENENKILKNSQKQSEVKIERRSKNPVQANVDAKNITLDYSNIRKLNDQTLSKVQKGKFESEENEKKYNILIEKFRNIEESRTYFAKCEFEKFSKIFEDYAMSTCDFLNVSI